MNYDPSFNSSQALALRIDLQARADMLETAARDFARQRHCMHKLEGALARWLLEHRLTFGDRFCTNALLARLPLPDQDEAGRAERRLRSRVAYSRALRPACIHALSLRRGELGAYRTTDAQITTRIHTRAFAFAGEQDWNVAPLDAARHALAGILEEERPSLPDSAPVTADGPDPRHA
ncbi:MAG: hypothetical protein AAGG09_01040 [Pseudomonadota bacterium]